MTVLDKLIKEYRKLDVKILRLKRFLENGVAPTEAEGVMMETQLSAMTLYKKMLEMRIEKIRKRVDNQK
ncbi:crAss001_48 related protein [Klebsiella pneumoniae]